MPTWGLVLAAGPRTDRHGNDVPPRILYGPDGSLLDIRAHSAVTVAGIDQHVRRIDPQVLQELCAHIGEVVIPDRADLGDRDRVYSHDHHRRGIVPKHQRLHVQRIVDRPGLAIRHIHPRDARPQRSRIAGSDRRDIAATQLAVTVRRA